MLIDLLGYVAGILVVISMLPQVMKSWKTKSTRDLSLAMFLILCTGIFMWLAYGIYLNDLPIIVANFVTLILAITMLVFKLKYR